MGPQRRARCPSRSGDPPASSSGYTQVQTSKRSRGTARERFCILNSPAWNGTLAVLAAPPDRAEAQQAGAEQAHGDRLRHRGRAHVRLWRRNFAVPDLEQVAVAVQGVRAAIDEGAPGARAS